MSVPLPTAASSPPGQHPDRSAAEAGGQRVRMLPTLLLGTVAIAVVVLIVTWAELVTGKIMIGFLQLPPVVLPLLFMLVVVNMAARRVAPGAALTAPELAVIFVM